jgi:uncharacterized protein (TIGR02147 family)
MIFTHSNYRSFLKTILSDRAAANPRYSLRAMARDIGFSSSQLSETLSGKTNFSPSAAQKIAIKLGLNTQETEYFCLLVQLESESDPEVRDLLLNKVRKIVPATRSISDLTVDQFKQMAEWYHCAIIELVNFEGFRFTPDNIAKKLGISKIDAELAVERLQRLEVIECDEKGNWTAPKQDAVVRSSVKSDAMRRFYRQMLKKASDSLETQTPQERFSGFETVPVAAEAMKEIDILIDKFLSDVVQVARKYPKKKSVYHLMVHFFNLTPKEK